MTEDFLQFIWKNGLFEHHDMVTDQQERIEVLNPGDHNTDAGPDFLNARIRIGAVLWAGNVEVHVRSSDWYRHNHQHDKSYDNVILQVVYQHDKPVLRSDLEPVPTTELRFDPHLYDNYRMLKDDRRAIPCRDRIGSLENDDFECWLRYLVTERLQQKVESISHLLSLDGYDWENAFYVVLARSFGCGVNSLPFEMLARSLPLTHLDRHKGNLQQIEALLFGQSGLLEQTTGNGDVYVENLRKEYLDLRKEYALDPMQKHLWKFLRVRPVNFPTIRISQLAVLLNLPFPLFLKILDFRDPEDLFHLFDIHASEYWETHYTFGNKTVRRTKKLGKESIRMLMINAVIPFLFIYGSLKEEEGLKDRAIEWLQSIPPERNRIVNRWTALGFFPSSAFYTQGLLQLANNYCMKKRCLACSVGTKIIRSGAA